MYKLFSNAYARMRYLRSNDIRSFLTKVFNVSLSFLMIFTLAFVTIETIDPEPVLATNDFACFTSGGKAYAYQSVWNGSEDRLELYRWEAGTGQSQGANGNTTLVATYEADSNNNFGYLSGSPNNISEVNSLMMDRDGTAFALLKQTDGDLFAFKLNAPSTEGGEGTTTYINSLTDGDNNAGTYYEKNGYRYLISSNGFTESKIDQKEQYLTLSTENTEITEAIKAFI